nr:MAG TPA: hypothetical protein [Caudoviricetes sp.]
MRRWQNGGIATAEPLTLLIPSYHLYFTMLQYR